MTGSKGQEVREKAVTNLKSEIKGNERMNDIGGRVAEKTTDATFKK